MATKPKQSKAVKDTKPVKPVITPNGPQCPPGYVSDGHGGCIRDPG